MGRKNVINPKQLKSVLAAAADFYSDEIDLRRTDNVGLQLITKNSSGLSAEWKIQATVDGSTWTDLQFSATMPVTGDDSFLVNLSEMPFKSVRAFFERASGSADAEVWLIAKTEGA